jgi:adenine phosphoribosyltransferase
MSDPVSIKSLIRTIPDHPRPGILFRDITTLLGDRDGLRESVAQLVAPFANETIDKVAGIEARGFIVGGAVAHQLETGFVPIRKHGKLPGRTIAQEYILEYGTDRVEIHVDAVEPGERVLIVDDLIATGGTAEAAISVIQRSGGVVVGVAVIIDLPDLGGSGRILEQGHRLVSLCEFAGD